MSLALGCLQQLLCSQFYLQLDATYPKEDEEKAREWMETIVGEPIGDDFFEGLKDGSYLCR